MTTHASNLYRALMSGTVSAHDLQVRLAVSPSTLRRLVEQAPLPGVLRIGQARATRYAALRIPRSTGASSWPLFQVGLTGNIQQIAVLHALERDQWCLSDVKEPWLLLGSDRGVFDGLPWCLDALRPQGFLGRLYANRAASLLGLPSHPTDWGDDHVLAAALVMGEDCPGDILIGQAARQRWEQRGGNNFIPVSQRPTAFANAATQVLAGGSGGSSAAGEQPKFGMSLQHPDGGSTHVFVKFSPSTTTPEGRRWADLLIAEYWAGVIMAQAGCSAATAQVMEIGDRVYLESERFDRCQTGGRRGVVSLGPIAYAFGCGGGDWNESAQGLAQHNVLSAADIQSIASLQDFGNLIANTDMHQGNLGLYTQQSPGPLTVAPVYDMLPMAYRPGTHTEPGIIQYHRISRSLDSHMRPWAQRFWAAVANDERVSDGFRGIAAQHAKDLLLPSPPMAPGHPHHS